MNLARTFDNVILGVSIFGGAFVINGSEELAKILDGPMIEDNTQSLDKYPTKPGIYRCSMEYWFEQGYNEGWIAHGESEWDLIPVKVERISLVKEGVIRKRIWQVKECEITAAEAISLIEEMLDY